MFPQEKSHNIRRVKRSEGSSYLGPSLVRNRRLLELSPCLCHSSELLCERHLILHLDRGKQRHERDTQVTGLWSHVRLSPQLPSIQDAGKVLTHLINSEEI